MMTKLKYLAGKCMEQSNRHQPVDSVPYPYTIGNKNRFIQIKSIYKNSPCSQQERRDLTSGTIADYPNLSIITSPGINRSTHKAHSTRPGRPSSIREFQDEMSHLYVVAKRGAFESVPFEARGVSAPT